MEPCQLLQTNFRDAQRNRERFSFRSPLKKCLSFTVERGKRPGHERNISRMAYCSSRNLRDMRSGLAIQTEDYEEAAGFYNVCRAQGIQGSSTDFLICAVAVRHGLAIFTDDRDFEEYQKVLPIVLYKPPKKNG